MQNIVTDPVQGRWYKLVKGTGHISDGYYIQFDGYKTTDNSRSENILHAMQHIYNGNLRNTGCFAEKGTYNLQEVDISEIQKLVSEVENEDNEQYQIF